MTGSSSAGRAKTLMVRGFHRVRDSQWPQNLVGILTRCLRRLPNEKSRRTLEKYGRDGSKIQKMCCDYLLTTRLFVTENTFGTPFARNPARFLSVSLSATPSSVTFPFFTIMWIEGTADSLYRCNPGAL
jgi:hypothetical protein